MNILIVGNGFDLSHYLPTKYDHFMDVMGAIENWGESKGDMNFDDLFGALYEKEDYFFDHTKAMYKTDEIKISGDQIKGLQEQLKENVWYQYFSDHVREIKTWIDFEQKIEDALKLVCKFINKIDSKFEKYGKLEDVLKILTNNNVDKEDQYLYLTELELELLKTLKLFIKNSNYGKTQNSGSLGAMSDMRKGFINKKWYRAHDKSEYGFSVDKYIYYLNEQLESFIFLFNCYLDLIISKLNPNCSLRINLEDGLMPERIYSFNYTNTYQRLHDSVAVEYLHGSCDEYQNIVLGISDLESESLKKIKAYGFTKYQQKLFKDTDYLFLDGYKSKILESKKMIEELKRQTQMSVQSAYIHATQRQLEDAINSQELNLNFYIWGHSLDISDKDYVLDLFSLNDDMDRNVRVTVYYFNKPAKFTLLNNLLAILGKDKVEQWMKNKWLQFKENPEIKFIEAEKQQIA